MRVCILNSSQLERIQNVNRRVQQRATQALSDASTISPSGSAVEIARAIRHHVRGRGERPTARGRPFGIFQGHIHMFAVY